MTLQIRFFTEVFSNTGTYDGAGGDAGSRGMQDDPALFVDRWLAPYKKALAAMLTPHREVRGCSTSLFCPEVIGNSIRDQSLLNTARAAVLELLHVPHDEWRTVVLAAVNLVRHVVIGHFSFCKDAVVCEGWSCVSCAGFFLMHQCHPDAHNFTPSILVCNRSTGLSWPPA